MAFPILLVVCLFISLFLHELGHCFLFIIFGVGIDKLIIGLPPFFSIPLRNDYIRNIALGPLPLAGFTVPDVSESLLLSSWQYILILLSGVAVNISLPLFGAWLHKKDKIFSDNIVYFLDLNLVLFILNIAPLPYLDGGKALINFLVFTGLVSSLSEFYNNLNGLVVLLWKFGGMLLIFFFLQRLVNFMKKFIQYDGLLPARKK